MPRTARETGRDNVRAVGAPELDTTDLHPLAVELWETTKESDQANFYGPSDWTLLKLHVTLWSKALDAPRINAQLVSALNSQASDLMLGEAHRRKAKLKPDEGDEAEARLAEVHSLADAMYGRSS